MTGISSSGGGRALVRAAVILLPALFLLSCGGDSPDAPIPNAPTLDLADAPTAAEEDSRAIGLTATDPDGDPLVFSASGLPSFAALTQLGAGAAQLTLSPLLGDAGSYPGVILRVTDGELTDSIAVTLLVTPLERVSNALFYEPPAFCVGGSETGDSLFVYNQSGQTLRWRAVRVPPGLTGLEGLQTLAPQSFSGVEWSWDPAGPYPVLDTLVVATSDEDHLLVSIPLRRQDPAGASDLTPPPAPLLAVPRDGARFTASPTVTIDVAWSELDDCSGIDRYMLEISLNPQFTAVVLRESVRGTAVQVIAEEGDVGPAYWRVYAVDGAGLRGPNSAVRSWTVVRP